MKFSFRSAVFMFLVTLFFTGLVSGVRILSERRIRSNRDIKRQRIVLRVLGISPPKGAEDRDITALYQSRVREIRVQGRSIYEGLEPDGATAMGYAFPVGGPGFWGPISGIAAVDPDVTRLLGLAFISHSETPGLGGRISEDGFTDQFRGLPLSPGEAAGRFIDLEPPGEGAGPPGSLDAITGATNTSAAVEAFLNRDLYRFLRDTAPELRRD